MSEFNTIDLMNYAVYGNDNDPDWDEIKRYIQTNAQARQEYEEIKNNLPQMRRPGGREKYQPRTSEGLPEENSSAERERKGWFGIF